MALNWLEEFMSNFQGGLNRGLSVGVDVALVSSTILARGDVLAGFKVRGTRLLLWRRVILGFGLGILARVGEVGRSLWRQIDDE